MTSNLRLVLVVSLLFGIATGVYEFVLPLYLKAQGISFQKIGFIFALAGVAVVLARIYMGGLADKWGRKLLYGWALAVCGGATISSAVLIPHLLGLVWQATLKTLRETASLTRDTIHPIVLYEEGRDGFLNRIGKFRGIEFLLQALGTVLAGVIIAMIGARAGGFQAALAVAGLIVLGATLWWTLCFHEHHRPSAQRIITLRELLNFDLHPNLRYILVAGMIFTFGVQLSHSFYMQLFYQEHFQLKEPVVAAIMVIHRLTIALPMLIVGNLRLKNLRAWYINGYIVQGVTVAVSALLPIWWLSAGVFLLHDLIGAGIWSPIQAALIQRYSRDETRGMEVGKVLAWGSIGSVLGPLVAGGLADIDMRLPFLISGVLMVLAAIPLFGLDQRLPSPRSTPSVPEPAA